MKNKELERDWLTYCTGIKTGELVSLYTLGINVGEPQNMGLASGYTSKQDKEQALALVSKLIAQWEALSTKPLAKGKEMSDEKKTFELCMEFIRKAERGSPSGFQELLDSGLPINFQHPKRLFTAMHGAASGNSENHQKIMRMMLDGDYDIDFLIEDDTRRTPWDLAVIWRVDDELRDRIFERTQVMAEKEGIDLRASFQEKLKNWMHTNWYSNINGVLDRQAQDNYFEP